MADFLSRASQDSRLQLVVTAVLSGSFVAATILGWQRLAHEDRVWELKHSLPDPRKSDPALRKLTRIGTATPSLSTTNSASSTSSALVPNSSEAKTLGYEPTKEDLHNIALARRAQAGDFDETLISEQLARNSAFLTAAGLDKLRNSFVVVVGLGGVGSHAVASLARSGCGRIRLVDFDQVTLSSLNRHAVATLADVGVSKVVCMQRRLAGIAPWVKFDTKVEKFDEKSAEKLLGPWTASTDTEARKPDFVVDAIDNIDTKVALLKYCHDHKIRVISAMGAGCKSDPTRVVVGDISETSYDALSKSVRRRLKLLGVTHGITAVFSTERTDEGKAQLLPLSDEEFQKGSVRDLGVLPDFRVRILPVLGTMPAVFGYTVANHVILQTTGYPTDYLPAKGSTRLYETVQAALQASEEKYVRFEHDGSQEAGVGVRIPITIGDIAFLVDDIYRGRSAVSGLPTRLVLTRWRKPASGILKTIGEDKMKQKSTNVQLHDLVCMTKEDAVIHEKGLMAGKSPEEMYEADVVSTVEARIAEIENYEQRMP